MAAIYNTSRTIPIDIFNIRTTPYAFEGRGYLKY